MQSHQAFAPHFDTHDVFALHCQGEKMWNIYENFENDLSITQFLKAIQKKEQKNVEK